MTRIDRLPDAAEMTAIVTSLLGGGWELVAGWILPAALSCLLFAVLVLPALAGVTAFHSALTVTAPQEALALLATAVIVGLILSAFQTSLYRILEGYLGWPPAVQRRRSGHHRADKDLLAGRLSLARLTRKEELGTLTGPEAAELAGLRDNPGLSKVPERTAALAPWQISVLAEGLRRYPVDNGQVLPTLLGNAIRRFEEYGYDRYLLDVVTMWHALTGAVPEQMRKQVDASRASVDFFVCLIYGHVAVIITAVVAIVAVPGHHPVGPLVAIVALPALSFLWYRLAVTGTDEWAAAVRGLVDGGRKPLAESLGLVLPGTLEEERTMWRLVSRMGRRPHDDSDRDLDPFRASPAAALSAVPVPGGRS